MPLSAARVKARAAYARSRELADRALAQVPLLRRCVRDLARIEVIDRSMAIAAQGLLALIPLLVVLAAVLPTDLMSTGLDKFISMTGVSDTGTDLDTVVDAKQVKAQTGLIGLALTIFSATSFARAIQRMYERVWAQRHIGGMAGIRRSFLWLLGWLIGLQMVALLLQSFRSVGIPRPMLLALQVVLVTALWWWTMHVLLLGRRHLLVLLPGAVLTGVALVVYSWASGAVMPRVASGEAAQFGTLGLVLAVATWLVGFAGILVVSAVLGRVIGEDRWVRRHGAVVLARVGIRAGRGSGPRRAPRSGG